MIKVKFETYRRSWVRDFIDEYHATKAVKRFQAHVHEACSISVTRNGTLIHEVHIRAA